MCTACDQHRTTVATGGTNESLDCVCVAGLYNADTRPARTHCVVCPPDTICDQANTRLEALLVAPGYWRQNGTSTDVRKCFTDEACLGGPNASGLPNVSCALSQTGPYCAVCAAGYFGGGDGELCEPCEGSTVFTFLPGIFLYHSLSLCCNVRSAPQAGSSLSLHTCKRGFFRFFELTHCSLPRSSTSNALTISLV